jgi:putative hydrolase of the HAD superfamily
MSRARGLLLDVGVVFYKSAWELVDDYEQARGLPPGTVPGRGPLDPAGDEHWARHQRGEITEHPTMMRAIFQQPGVDAVRPEGRAVVLACLDAGIRVGILTNELMDFQGREWVEAQEWFPWFSFIVDSTELGVRKPDPHPYEVAIEQMGMDAGDIVFIDDNPTYVRGGIKAGLRSVLLDVHDPAGAFRNAVLQLGLPWSSLDG